MQLEIWIDNANSSILSDFGNSWVGFELSKVVGALCALCDSAQNDFTLSQENNGIWHAECAGGFEDFEARRRAIK